MSTRKRFALGVFFGALAALGHAPFGLWPIALAGFLGLFWLVTTSKRPGWAAYAVGIGYFAVVLHWIVEPFLVDAATHGWMAPFALILCAAGFALFWGASGWLAGRAFPNRRALAFAVLLTGAELLRGHILTGFPWALPAYIWADTPMRMVVAWTGSYGLSLLMLVSLALPFAIGRVAGTLWAAAILGITFASGTMRAASVDETALLGQIRLVQPNVPQNEKWDFEKVPQHLQRLIDFSREAEAELVVWPESSVAYHLDQAGPVLQAASNAAGVPIILGLNRRAGDEIWHNSLAVVETGGRVADTYDKVHLVPFGEYIPFRIDLLRAMAASSGFGFTSGEAVRLIETPLGRALPLICYEGIFPGHIFKADARADYLLQITNDAWFGNFSGPFQHLDQMRFRAAEQGLPLVRAANTGVSAVIDRFGRVEASLELNEGGFLDHAVHGGERTLYSYTGDWPAIFIVLLSITALLSRKSRNTVASGHGSS
ncbi:MAG: apolipoprotein N-acyltransferase [Pseudomonadota bacterium]